MKISKILTLVFLTVLVSCSSPTDSNDGDNESSSGSLRVETVTEGFEIDPDGYTVTVGNNSKSIGVNDTTVFSNLSIGTQHTVSISDLSDNCSLEGKKTRSVFVYSSPQASVRFNVTCTGNEGTPVTMLYSTGDLWVLYGNGYTEMLINLETQITYPRWSPDGNKLAFASAKPDYVSIFTTNNRGENLSNITPEFFRAIDPAWSPNGRWIAFQGQMDRDGNIDIYKKNLETGEVVQLTDEDVSSGHIPGAPTWSPDGAKIAFATYRDGNWEIYSMNADGTNETNLSQHPDADYAPDWSPDGERIVFWTRRHAETHAGNREIYIMNTDGTGQTRITFTEDQKERDPDFSPDGSKIAFSKDVDNSFEIFIMSSDGSEVEQITNTLQEENWPDWRPHP